MFGQDDRPDETADAATTIEPTVTPGTTDDIAVTDDGTVVPDSGSTDDAAVSDTPTEETPVEEAPAEGPAEAETPAAPAESTESTEETPAEEPAAEVEEETPTISTHTPAADVADDSLLEIKKEALSDLAPLVDHLDQTPEEHFKTVMMLIQATDDSTYVKAAYESAKNITDDDARAQALLDIVNEINYFTQAHNNTSEEN